ncbi:nuclear transport factor 2 family protein [Nocardioides sp. LML1-1-1.1]|uniref:nuclear transport factor 2 family protein n=1 Tax=Nocardioides sp. LML1-1-1.1 TaxID=3135248 RepID=UPI003412A3E7
MTASPDRLLRLEEIEATRSLLASYARAADAASVERMLALFTVDGVVANRRGELAGAQAIGRYFRDTWGADPVEKRHFVTNLEVTWHGPGEVRTEAYFLFVARTPAASTLGWGRYDADVRVEEGTARFARLRMDLDVATDLAAGWPAG